MKIEFTENKNWSAFTLTPETAAETAQLIRMVKNSKAKKPAIFISFSKDEPWCSVQIDKVKENLQNNAISNG